MFPTPSLVRALRLRQRLAVGLPAARCVAALAVLAAPAPAQLLLEEACKRHLPVELDGAQAVVSGDVDGDGDLDLVAAGSGRTRLYANDGTGRFVDLSSARMPGDSSWTWAAALGDVDGDGDLDLVLGNDSSQNRLYRNDGSGTFVDATVTHLPVDADRTRAVALGDVDGDGDLDLLCGNMPRYNGPTGQDRLYLNDGAGRFTDVTSTHLPGDADTTSSVGMGDVDGDGDLDLVFGNVGPNRLYRNDGGGRFTDVTAARLPHDVDSTWSVVLADLDGDGDLDLVCGNALTTPQNRLYLNDGAGNFSDLTAVRFPADASYTASLIAADVDGDGDLDLLCGNQPDFFGASGQDRLYENDGTGHFTDRTIARMPEDAASAGTMTAGDFDGDGEFDLICGNRLYLGDGSGFANASATALPAHVDLTSAVALGDVDGDGDLDLICGNDALEPVHYQHLGKQNRLYRNDGWGRFVDSTASSLPVDLEATLALALGDVDADGDLDLVCGNAPVPGGSTGQNRLLRNDGVGGFVDATAQLPVDGDDTRAIALGDVDGDGDLDVLCGNFAQNRLYRNDGSGTFVDITATHLPVDSDFTTSVALGDVDADGDLDLVWGTLHGNGQNRLYLNDGTGRFLDGTAAGLPAGGYPTTSVALGDVDGDGDLDLVCGNSGYMVLSWCPEPSRLYLNDGSGRFTDAVAGRFPDSGSVSAIALGDVDGDGDLDLLCGRSEGRSGVPNGLYLNDGTGWFTEPSAVLLAADRDATVALALGDVDADGDLDLVCGNVPVPDGAAGQNRLFTNLRRQLRAPLLLRVGKPWVLEAVNRPGSATTSSLALPYLSDTRISLPLPGLGVLGIDPQFALPLVQIPLGGVGAASLSVPNDPALAGGTIHAQALLVEWPVEARLTNVVTDRVLR